jgi:hypothetical protein
LFAPEALAVEREPAVTLVIVEHPPEPFPAHLETHVEVTGLEVRLRLRQPLGQPDESLSSRRPFGLR